VNEVTSNNRTYLWLVISGVVVALFSFGARMAGDATARQVGQVIGAILGAYLVAAMIWTILWAIAGRRKGRRWLSAWIGWIAIAVAFLVAVSRNSEAAQSGMSAIT
jgi:hypothetical protein